MYAHTANNTNFKNMKTPLPLKREYKCKVCFDAGMPESMYNSHYVRQTPDIRSKVVCPTLLAVTCSYCQKKGHTPSRCLKKERDESTLTYSSFDNDSMNTWTTVSSKPQYCIPTNLYSLLNAEADDEDDEDDDDTVLTMESPVTDSTASYTKNPYLLALMKPVPVIENTAQCKYAYFPNNVRLQQKEDTEKPKKSIFSRCWADYDSDSDSD